MDLTQAQASCEGAQQASPASGYGGANGQTSAQDSALPQQAQAYRNLLRWLPTWVFFWSLRAGILCL